MGDFPATTSLSSTREGLTIGANSIEERDAVRRYLASRVRREIPQRWNDSKAELTELIEMLGLHTKYDDEASRTLSRASVRDCAPVPQPTISRRPRASRKVK